MKNLLPVEQIAAKLDLPENLYEKRSPVSARLSLDLLNGLPKSSSPNPASSSS